MYDLFNSKNDREYFSNVDYVKVGGEQQEWDTVSHYDQEEVKKCLKTQWKALKVTSQLGNLKTQKTQVPSGYTISSKLAKKNNE